MTGDRGGRGDAAGAGQHPACGAKRFLRAGGPVAVPLRACCAAALIGAQDEVRPPVAVCRTADPPARTCEAQAAGPPAWTRRAQAAIPPARTCEAQAADPPARTPLVVGAAEASR